MLSRRNESDICEYLEAISLEDVSMKNADIDRDNMQGGEYGNALQAASYGGYEKLVQLLLDKDAEVDA